MEKVRITICISSDHDLNTCKVIKKSETVGGFAYTRHLVSIHFSLKND